jgi:hypothetical protein
MSCPNTYVVVTEHPGSADPDTGVVVVAEMYALLE